MISNDKEVAETLNKSFSNAVKNLDIKEPIHLYKNIDSNTNLSGNDQNITSILKKYEDHPSIIKIKENVNTSEQFSFHYIRAEEIEEKVKNIHINNGTCSDDIPAKIISECSDIVAPFLTEICDKSIYNCEFPHSLKLADISPIHKKEETTKKENYRPVSLLLLVSKILERNMYEQIIAYIDKSLSPYLCGFRKGNSTQHCLIVMVEQWKKALDKKQTAGAILTDLSKAFYCINHDLLIAKLNAYGFDKNALKFIHTYFTGRK